jgi:hypothetical protein
MPGVTGGVSGGVTSGATPNIPQGTAVPSTGSIEGSAQGATSSGSVGAATSGSPTSVGVMQAETSSATSGASVQTDASVQTSNIENAATRAPEQASGASDVQSNVSASTIEGRSRGAMGSDGAAVMGGGTAGVEGKVGVESMSPERETAKVTSETKMDAIRSTDASADGAVSASGYSDPVGEVGRAQQLEFNERDQAMGRVSHAEDQAGAARGVAADPSGAAQSKATDAASDAAREASPVDAGQARADVNVATGAVNDPSGTARARADVEVEGQKREATAKVGVTPPKPDDDPTK